LVAGLDGIDAQPGGQPDAPIHGFYLASGSAARRLPYTLEVRGSTMKLRIALIVIVLASVSAAAWAIYEKREMDRFALSMLYLDTAAKLKYDLQVLSVLREGHPEKAIEYLERRLEFSMSTLEGCKFDICAQSMPDVYAEPLRLAKVYRQQYQGK
jgi:hypothetical protein